MIAPVLLSGRDRAESTSSGGSDDSIKELPDSRDRPSASWADSGTVMQQPALTYHQGPSVTTIASSDDADLVPYVGYTPAPPVATRKRFRAPQKSTMLDRSVGNVSCQAPECSLTTRHSRLVCSRNRG